MKSFYFDHGRGRFKNPSLLITFFCLFQQEQWVAGKPKYYSVSLRANRRKQEKKEKERKEEVEKSGEKVD